MGENYGSLEELWKVFGRIEEAYYAKITIPTRGEIFQKFESEKLKLMSERVVKNINNQNSMLIQAKEIELENAKSVLVILPLNNRKNKKIIKVMKTNE